MVFIYLDSDRACNFTSKKAFLGFLDTMTCERGVKKSCLDPKSVYRKKWSNFSALHFCSLR